MSKVCVNAHLRVNFTFEALVPAHSLAPLYPKRANCTCEAWPQRPLSAKLIERALVAGAAAKQASTQITKVWTTRKGGKLAMDDVFSY